jgi:hypothetical protein
MTSTPSRRLTSTLVDIRTEFKAFTDAFSMLSVRKAHFAPAFMKAFALWERETGRSFVAFVQQLDSTVPADRNEYPKHRAFQAACYLRRLVEAPATVSGKKERVSMSPFALLAVVLKSLAPIVGAREATHAFGVVVKAGKLHQRDADRLRKAIESARVMPLLSHQPRLVKETKTVSSRGPIALASDRERRATS